MSVLSTKCAYCGKTAKEESFEIVGGYRESKLACGHLLISKVEETKVTEVIDSGIVLADGRRLFPYQVESVLRAEKANFRFGLFHEQGLGKTVIALALMKLHPELFPVIVVCKAALRIQWFYEILSGLGEEFVPQILEKGQDLPMPDFFKVFITGADTLRRFAWAKDAETIKAAIPGLKTVILDECQSVKNPSAERTARVREVVKAAEHFIPLSGTPIKNNAYEYFTILNMINPTRFPKFEWFVQDHVQIIAAGRYKQVYGGLKNPERFKVQTEDLLYRCTRDEVMPDLPKVFRSFRFATLGDKVKEEYKKEMKAFNNAYDEAEEDGLKDVSSILAIMSRLRHLTGLAKINPTVDFIADFIMENPGKKLTVFVHHKDVGDKLYEKLSVLLKEDGFNPPLVLKADSPHRDDFIGISNERMPTGFARGWVSRDPRDIILIASTLAAGEGLNLQECSDMIMLERQWTPANEEQVEGRFSRIGSIATSIMAIYMCAKGTIDEMFASIVERKRAVVDSTMKREKMDMLWNEKGLMRELMDELRNSGAAAWKMAG